LTSPLALIDEPDRGSAAANAILSSIYNYWTTLPRENRPRLYLHGLSLGALNSESSVDLFEILGDPINGALWSGPPFANPLWRSFTANRNPGSTAWLPEYRDGSIVRFMNQNGYPDGARYAPWGAMRIVYLQYASDSVSFFSPLGFYREPAWMNEPRGPDISPELRWYPVVTMLQLLVDMAFATTTPLGYGHLYAPEHYVAAWHEVTEPPDWTDDELERLKLHLRAAMDAAVDSVEARKTPTAIAAADTSNKKGDPWAALALQDCQAQPFSFAVISARRLPWKLAPSSSCSLGKRDPSPSDIVVIP